MAFANVLMLISQPIIFIKCEDIIPTQIAQFIKITETGKSLITLLLNREKRFRDGSCCSTEHSGYLSLSHCAAIRQKKKILAVNLDEIAHLQFIKNVIYVLTIACKTCNPSKNIPVYSKGHLKVPSHLQKQEHHQGLMGEFTEYTQGALRPICWVLYNQSAVYLKP